jgi:hypothetical protein
MAADPRRENRAHAHIRVRRARFRAGGGEGVREVLDLGDAR